MKRRLRSPLDLLKPDLHKRVEKEQARQKEAHDKHVRARSFVIGEAVYIKNFGRDSSSRSWLSGHVKQYCGPLSYKVELPDGRVNRRHVDHIRKRYDNDLPMEASAETSEDLPPTSPQTVRSPIVPPETSSAEDSQELMESSAASKEQSVPRYPARNRRPPDRYEAVWSNRLQHLRGEECDECDEQCEHHWTRTDNYPYLTIVLVNRLTPSKTCTIMAILYQLVLPVWLCWTCIKESYVLYLSSTIIIEPTRYYRFAPLISHWLSRTFSLMVGGMSWNNWNIL